MVREMNTWRQLVVEGRWVRRLVALSISAWVLFGCSHVSTALEPTPRVNNVGQMTALQGKPGKIVYTYMLPGEYPSSPVRASDGNVWFTLAQKAAIGNISPLGVVTEFPLPQGESAAFEITRGVGGVLWFSDGTSIGKISTAGVIQEFPLPISARATGGIVYGPDHNIWFCDYFSSSIGKMTARGSVTEYPISKGALPVEITVGPDNNIWFTEYSHSSVGRMALDGVVTEFSLPNEFGPQGIVSAPDGYLYVATQNKSILRISTAGAVTTFKTPVYIPEYLIVGPDKNLWISYHSRIGNFSLASHTFSGTVSAGRPAKITVGSDGDLWFANPYYSGISVFEQAGTNLRVGATVGYQAGSSIP